MIPVGEAIFNVMLQVFSDPVNARFHGTFGDWGQRPASSAVAKSDCGRHDTRTVGTMCILTEPHTNDTSMLVPGAATHHPTSQGLACAACRRKRFRSSR